MYDNRRQNMYDNVVKYNNRGDWGLMFNNINENNKDLLYNSQFQTNNVVNLASVRSAFQKNNGYNNTYVDKTEISSSAMELFRKDLDIKKFTQIAMSDPEDKSYLSRMQELFAEGVIDAYEDDVIEELVTNSKLWDDLES